MKTLLRFIGTYWFHTLLGPPLIVVGFCELASYGYPSFGWGLFTIALMVLVSLILGGWIRDAWLRFNGLRLGSADRTEPDGSHHSQNVQDNNLHGRLRDAEGNRLFNSAHMLGFADYFVQFHPTTPADQDDLDRWVKENKIP